MKRHSGYCFASGGCDSCRYFIISWAVNNDCKRCPLLPHLDADSVCGSCCRYFPLGMVFRIGLVSDCCDKGIPHSLGYEADILLDQCAAVMCAIVCSHSDTHNNRHIEFIRRIKNIFHSKHIIGRFIQIGVVICNQITIYQILTGFFQFDNE